jgi:hypothetical protein
VAVAAVAVALAAGGCSGEWRLDETVFHDTPELQLKVVRYYENLPFHYSGEIYVVMCRSEATRDFPANETQDAGWRTLGRGGAIGTKRAGDVVQTIADRYRPDGAILVWLGTVFQVSFDACGHFATWDPTALPPGQIDPVEKPDYCAPEGSADCRYYDFQGERAPAYDEIHAGADGHVSFRVRSGSLRGVEALRVASDDFGRTWAVAPVAASP